jgi:hypothetical protein
MNKEKKNFGGSIRLRASELESAAVDEIKNGTTCRMHYNSGT